MAVPQDQVVSEHPLANGAEPFDRALRTEVPQVGLELHPVGRLVLEGMSEHQELALRIDRSPLKLGRVPGPPNLDRAVRPVDLQVPGHSDWTTVGAPKYGERKVLAGGLPFQQVIDEPTHRGPAGRVRRTHEAPSGRRSARAREHPLVFMA